MEGAEAAGDGAAPTAPPAPPPSDPAAPVEDVEKRILYLLEKNGLSAQQLKDFESFACAWTSEQVSALVSRGLIPLLTKYILVDPTPQSCWEVVYRVLLRISTEDDTRPTVLEQGLVAHLGNAVLTGAQKARGENQIANVLDKSRALAAVTLDADDRGLFWAMPLARIQKEGLAKAVAKGTFTDAYVALSLVSKLLPWLCQTDI